MGVCSYHPLTRHFSAEKKSILLVTVQFCFTDRYFLIQRLDSEPTMYDTVSARDITHPEGVHVLDLKPGDGCQASYEHRHYRVKVIAAGKYITELHVFWGKVKRGGLLTLLSMYLHLHGCMLCKRCIMPLWSDRLAPLANTEFYPQFEDSNSE